MTEITEKLNADRAIRVWAIEQTFSAALIAVSSGKLAGFTADGIVADAAKLEHYVLTGKLKIDTTAPPPEEIQDQTDG